MGGARRKRGLLLRGTASAPGWVPRAFLKGRERRTFILSFFGLSSVEHGLALPLAQVLTPYPSNDANTFLGFAMKSRWLKGGETATADASAGTVAAADGPGDVTRQALPTKKRQGIVWGKRAEYFSGKVELLAAVAKLVDTLVVTVPPGSVPGLGDIPNIHQVRENADRAPSCRCAESLPSFMT